MHKREKLRKWERSRIQSERQARPSQGLPPRKAAPSVEQKLREDRASSVPLPAVFSVRGNSTWHTVTLTTHVNAARCKETAMV